MAIPAPTVHGQGHEPDTKEGLMIDGAAQGGVEPRGIGHPYREHARAQRKIS